MTPSLEDSHVEANVLVEIAADELRAIDREEASKQRALVAAAIKATGFQIIKWENHVRHEAVVYDLGDREDSKDSECHKITVEFTRHEPNGPEFTVRAVHGSIAHNARVLSVTVPGADLKGAIAAAHVGVSRPGLRLEVVPSAFDSNATTSPEQRLSSAIAEIARTATTSQ